MTSQTSLTIVVLSMADGCGICCECYLLSAMLCVFSMTVPSNIIYVESPHKILHSAQMLRETSSWT